MKRIMISDLEFANKLTPNFVDNIEQFLPMWLDSLIPYYKEAKLIEADNFKLVNHKPCGASCKLYEKDGVGYYLSEMPWNKELSFNADFKYMNCSWYECFREFYPKLKENFWESCHNFMGYNLYFSKIWNLEEKYSCVAQRVDNYFKNITNDPNVNFVLSGTSTICLTEKGLKYARTVNIFE